MSPSSQKSVVYSSCHELQNHAAALAGSILSPWLPYGFSRRLLMLAIVALGVQQAVVGNYQALLWWLLLPAFSPRIVGLGYICRGPHFRHYQSAVRSKHHA